MRFNRTISLVITGVISLVLLLGINIVASKKSWRWDLTANKLFSLSPQTANVFKELDKEVKAVAFYYPNAGDKNTIKEMFELCKKETDFFEYEFVDPDREPYRAKELDVNKFPVVVLLSDNRQETIPFPSEEDIVNGVVRVTDDVNRKVYFVEGHGELDIHASSTIGINKIKELLRNQGMEVNILPLALQENVPEDATALAIVGPRKDFLDTEIQMLVDFLDKGGRLYICLSAENRTNLDDFIADHLGIRRLDGMVVDMVSKTRLGDFRIPLVQKYSNHPITAKFKDMVTMYPTATSFRPKVNNENLDENAQVQLLGRTSHTAWQETYILGLNKDSQPQLDPATDTQGPLAIFATFEIADPPPETDEGGNPLPPKEEKKPTGPKPRAVVFGDQDFMSNQYVQFGGNMDLVRNSFNWLMERENILNLIKKRENIFLLLRSNQSFVLTWVPRVVVPLLALLMALGVTILRRPRKKTKS